jgi:hypothetical protein
MDMRIKVNMAILGRRPREIVKDGDRDYEVFLRYAEKKAKRNGCPICSVVKGSDKVDRPAIIARLNELNDLHDLGLEFKGNAKNDVLVQLLMDAEKAAEEAGAKKDGGDPDKTPNGNPDKDSEDKSKDEESKDEVLGGAAVETTDAQEESDKNKE